MRVTTDVEERANGELRRRRVRTATQVRVGVRSGYVRENDTLSSWNTPPCSKVAREREREIEGAESEGEKGRRSISGKYSASSTDKLLRSGLTRVSLRSFRVPHPLSFVFAPPFSSSVQRADPFFLPFSPLGCYSRVCLSPSLSYRYLHVTVHRRARQRAVRHEILR